MCDLAIVTQPRRVIATTEATWKGCIHLKLSPTFLYRHFVDAETTSPTSSITLSVFRAGFSSWLCLNRGGSLQDAQRLGPSSDHLKQHPRGAAWVPGSCRCPLDCNTQQVREPLFLNICSPPGQEDLGTQVVRHSGSPSAGAEEGLWVWREECGHLVGR